MKSKLISGEEASRLLRDGDLLAIEGSGGGVKEPTYLLRMLRKRFEEEGKPRDLTLYHANGIGDKKEIGTDLLALEGLTKRDIAGHWGMAPAMARLALEEKVEAYNLPQGVLSQMYQAIAANKPGVITKVGLNTFIDPRIEGGKMNKCAKMNYVKLLEIDGEEWLYFPKQKIDICFIRGTTADLNGNITMEQEAAILEGLSIAQATKNSGGVVIAQVKYIAENGCLKAQEIKVPGIYVDYIVIDSEQKQCSEAGYNPALCGVIRMPLGHLPPLVMDERKIIARRAAKELFPGAVVNLGVGIPSGVASVMAEKGSIQDITFTVEQGIIGGVPAGGLIFGISYNPVVIIEQTHQFNFYDGGGLNVAFLGMAQADQYGNVNSSKTGKLLSGCGGFINISQNAKKVVFCAAFTAKGLRVNIEKAQLNIVNEGQIIKFKQMVDQITFSGKYAKSIKQKVLYITERAVFELNHEGVVLKEIAPGVDLEKDILSLMDFKPIIAKDLKNMDTDIFI